jgi:hypothetical protein
MIDVPHSLISRAEFLADLRAAIEQGSGYAAGKIGLSEKHWMYYPILLNQEPSPLKRRVFEAALLFHGLKQEGIFPAQPEFYRKYNDFYLEHIHHIDCLGLFLLPVEMETAIVDYYQLQNKLIYFADQEPDRSLPSRAENCYLPYFAGKKVLLVCPFAGILKERATEEIFNGVWSKIGKKWFHPASVDALEFPYGFEAETQTRFTTALQLFENIKAQITQRDFDIALIGAGGLGIPLASFVKRMGKIGISLGGHLQVLFGVIGKRWRDREDWQHDYFNEWWIDMPARYKPHASNVSDAGAYW